MTVGLRATPRPFLKWVGGKRQLLPALVEEVERAGAFQRYHEPFVGGGALFFELIRTGKIGRRKACLSDNNANLVATYRGIKDDVDAVVELLRRHKQLHGETHYYAVRKQNPEALSERAARIIYLNKTGYNGLYRENSKGEYNVPFGRYVNPAICDEENLRAVAEALGRATIECRGFSTVLSKAAKGDLVYFDPPYHPVSKTASFTQYDKSAFGANEQRELARIAKELHKGGVKVIISNSDTPLINEIYEGGPFHVRHVMASRMVNSRGDRRGKVGEVIVTTY